MPGFLQPKPQGAEDVVARAAGATAPREARDIEAPEIFEAKEAGLWDGRPSLGGVWVAHPDVKDPERVIIRNETNGQFVIGALFRKERQTPGPRLQVSSDAAAAIGMLAGQPVNLHVVALKREEVAVEPAPEPLPDAAETLAEPVPDAPDVTEGPLDPVVAGASAALDAAPAATADTQPLLPDTDQAADQTADETVAVQTASTSGAVPDPAPKPAARSALDKPYIQIGIFSVQQNARNTATAMRQAGMVPTVKQQSARGKTFWRVVVGPAQNKSERSALLDTIKGTGFTDAYAVTH